MFGLSLRKRQIVAPVLYLLATALLVGLLGVPYQRDILAVWMLLGLLCFSLSDLRGYARGVVLEWLPFIAILVAYDALRGSAAHTFGVHYLPQLQADKVLFGGSLPTVTLQHSLWHGHVVWYDIVFWAVYLTHFFATPLLAAVLWKVDRLRFRSFAGLVVILSFAGLATYALYPAAPPWMASQAHLTAPILRILPSVWNAVGIHSAGSVIESGYKYSNNVAAVPSLHTAFAMLVAITLWPRKRKWLRPIVAAYPLAMGFTLIYTGEHYFSDVALGWIYAIVTVLAGRAALRRFSARKPAREPAAAREPAVAPEPSLTPEPAYAKAAAFTRR